MNILITNDDGYKASGIHSLVRIMRQFGSVTVVAPKYHQSGMGMAVSMGFKPVAVKELGYDEDGVRWIYADGTPASCVKFGIDNVFTEAKPDVIVCGINHGSNAATAACYSGTLGAAQEAAINDVLGIGVSLDNLRHDADFSAIEQLFPDIFSRIISESSKRYGIYYNVNFPNLPADRIKGIRIGHQGIGHWEREFRPYDSGICQKLGIDAEAFGLSRIEAQAEDGEKLYMMVGDFIDDKRNTAGADHHILRDGYISITAHNLLTTDDKECELMKKNGFEKDWR